MTLLVKFWHIRYPEKRLLLEALVLLLISNAVIAAVPFKRIERFLRTYPSPPEGKDGNDPQMMHGLLLIKRATTRASKLLPWSGLCLSRSIASFIMARRRRIPVVMFLGVKILEDNSLSAHAWVNPDRKHLEGSSAAATFTTLLTIR